MVTEEKERESVQRNVSWLVLHYTFLALCHFFIINLTLQPPAVSFIPERVPCLMRGLDSDPLLHLCPGPVFPITLFSLTGLALFLLYRSEWYEKCSLLELTGDKNILSSTDKLKGTLKIKTHQSCSELIFKIGLYSQKCRAIIEHCWIFKALLNFFASGCTVIAQE